MQKFRVILFLICSSIFLYQYIQVTKSHLRYQKTTRVRYDDTDTPMQAFTFCLKHPFVSMQKFNYLKLGANRTHEGNLDYDFYMNELNLTKPQFHDFLTKEFLKQVNKGKLKEMLLDTTYLKEFNFFVIKSKVKFRNGSNLEISITRLSQEINNYFTSQMFTPETSIYFFGYRKCFSFFRQDNFNIKYFSFFQRTTTYYVLTIRKRSNV